MLAAAERARVKHMVQFTNRGLPHYRWIKHLLDDGYICMPYHAYFTWLGLVSGTAAEFVPMVG
jgi:predicted dehydrogenase